MTPPYGKAFRERVDQARRTAGGTVTGANHAAAAAPAAPVPVKLAPVDNGERLGTIPRSDSEELRVSWGEYQGHHFLNLRVWVKDAHDQWWPDKTKGCTVRPRDLPQFADAIATALDKLEKAG